MLLQFLYQFIAGFVFPLLAEYNGSLNYHTTDVIRYTRDGTLYNGWVSHQGTLNLEWANAVT